MELNVSLRDFQMAVQGCKDDQRMAYVDGNLGKADKSVGILGRSKTITVGHQQTTQALQNNAVRTALLKALSDQFGGNDQIPQSVRDALKGSSLVGGSDMKTDAQGNVISGRPLTARRINAVLTAVMAEIRKVNDADKSPYWQGDFSAQGAEPSDRKIRERLQAMADVCEESRYRQHVISINTVSNFKTLILSAQKKGCFGKDMVDFIVGRIKARNNTSLGNPDAQWFHGTKDETTDRLRRDVCRFLNLGNAYGDYWQDPKAAVENDKKMELEAASIEQSAVEDDLVEDIESAPTPQ